MFEFDKSKSQSNLRKQGKDVTDVLDLSRARRPLQAQKRVNVDFPTWMVRALDSEARRVAVTRQSIIKMWLAERLERTASNQSLNTDAGEDGAG